MFPRFSSLRSLCLKRAKVTLTCLEYLKTVAKPKMALGENVSTGNINQNCVEVLQDTMSSKDTRCGIVSFWNIFLYVCIFILKAVRKTLKIYLCPHDLGLRQSIPNHRTSASVLCRGAESSPLLSGGTVAGSLVTRNRFTTSSPPAFAIGS